MKLVKRENPDVVVIGGSSVGLETAYYLRKFKFSWVILSLGTKPNNSLCLELGGAIKKGDRP